MLLNQFLLLAAVLFCIGVYGVLARRNAVMVLMSIELILNAVNINLVAFAAMNGDIGGQVFPLAVVRFELCAKVARHDADGKALARIVVHQPHVGRQCRGFEGVYGGKPHSRVETKSKPLIPPRIHSKTPLHPRWSRG